ncbi:NlpC/P60 family protein [Bailinhaonella thermotolerans]|uniref:NlpC/P60 family protein n=1 Tax=Bailinhaonella thermotolerans TaxID=1070861 RepID=A0A3A4ATF6_9ACTN|nr:NlpC/P60 family protein [Bailinhaonella thermotolerans]RJL32663.1 NlpC/P60 family protein [Bailinhaonella thermotolerans]
MRRWTLLLGLLVTLAVTAPLTLPPTAAVPYGAAHADPVRDLESQVRELSDKAEVVTEKYNERRLHLRAAEGAERAARDRLAEADRLLAGARERLRAIALARHTGMPPHPVIALIGSPGTGADTALRRGMLARYVTEEETAELAAYESAARERAAARDHQHARAAEIARITADLGRKKRDIEGLLSRARARLADLRARGASPSSPPRVAPPPVSGDGKAATAVRAALSQVGKPYRWGQADPRVGFDCSGLTMWAYAQAGISLPHYTGAQYRMGRKVARSQLRPGDLVFFYSDLHHVGLYLGDGTMVHAPSSGRRVEVVTIATRPYAGAVRVA